MLDAAKIVETLINDVDCRDVETHRGAMIDSLLRSLEAYDADLRLPLDDLNRAAAAFAVAHRRIMEMDGATEDEWMTIFEWHRDEHNLIKTIAAMQLLAAHAARGLAVG